MKPPGLAADMFRPDESARRECCLEFDAKTPLEGGPPLVFRTPNPRPDWSGHNRLRLIAENLTDRIVLAGLRLFHGPDGRAVSLSGGRAEMPPGSRVELLFPRGDFDDHDENDQWADVRGVEFVFAREKTDADTAPIKVSLVGLDGEFLVAPPGPRLTAAGSARIKSKRPTRSPATAIFDLNHPGLGIPPPHPYPGDTADRVLSGRIMGRPAPEPIDWEAAGRGDLEWRHFLHRHHFLMPVARAFARTGRPKYARYIARVVSDWIRRHPVPLGSNGGAGPAWETLSMAWRLRQWLWIRGLVRPYRHFPRQARDLMWRSVWEQAQSLVDHQGHPTNWRIVEAAALTLTGICWPEFEVSLKWVSLGLDRLTKACHNQFFDDGVHFELSPLYHAICLQAGLEVKYAADSVGQKLPTDLGRTLARAADYLAALRRPDGSWPAINDSGGFLGDYRAVLRLARRVLAEDATWRNSTGRPMISPRVFDRAGVVVFRSGPTRSDHQALFRAGPAGAAHVHGDVLSLDVTAFGRPCLVDPGISSYAPGPLTDHYRSAQAHNTVLIDGRGPVRSALGFGDRIGPPGGDLTVCRHGPGLETATGVCRGPWDQASGGLTVTRTVVFVGGEYWIVRDIIAGPGRRDVGVTWQFAPGRIKVDAATRTISFGGPDRAGLELIPLSGPRPLALRTISGGLDPPGGWVADRGRDRPAPGCRFSLCARLPVTLVWVLWPRMAKESPADQRPPTRRRDGHDQTIVVEVGRAGRRDTVTLGRPDARADDPCLRAHGRIDITSGP